jgi:hypothetical protein
MDLTITVLTSLSALAVIFTIIFEGKLKKSSRQKAPIKVISEIRNVSLFGWVLILISLSMIIGNGYIAQQNIVDTNDKYIQDTIANSKLLKVSNELNVKLMAKSISDSITISNLEKLTLDNGLKSDSIKLTIVDNAVKTLNEQRQAIEKERQNIFTHFRNEVEDNLRKVLLSYDEKRILGFGDSSFFMGTRLNNTYIKKYEAISTQNVIIDHLMETSEAIEKVNYYADEVTKTPKSETKNINIRMFLGNVKTVQDFLYPIYYRVLMLNSYRQYESINFSDSIPPPNRDSLNQYILMDYYFKREIWK